MSTDPDVKTEKLATTIQRLAKQAEPVSFYDAVEILSEVKRYKQVSEENIQALIVLHDAPVTTLGAQKVLAQFLKKMARQ